MKFILKQRNKVKYSERHVQLQTELRVNVKKKRKITNEHSKQRRKFSIEPIKHNDDLRWSLLQSSGEQCVCSPASESLALLLKWKFLNVTLNLLSQILDVCFINPPNDYHAPLRLRDGAFTSIRQRGSEATAIKDMKMLYPMGLTETF